MRDGKCKHSSGMAQGVVSYSEGGGNRSGREAGLERLGGQGCVRDRGCWLLNGSVGSTRAHLITGVQLAESRRHRGCVAQRCCCELQDAAGCRQRMCWLRAAAAAVGRSTRGSSTAGSAQLSHGRWRRSVAAAFSAGVLLGAPGPARKEAQGGTGRQRGHRASGSATMRSGCC